MTLPAGRLDAMAAGLEAGLLRVNLAVLKAELTH